MLQQTTVAAVKHRYESFLSRFPDLTALAKAREDRVLAAWSGLGYYGRARHLHRAAREVVRRHGGRLPEDPKLLRALPGFGDYTAAAVASLAFGVRAPAADANVTRVLSRLFALSGTVGTVSHRRTVLRHAEDLLPSRQPGDLTAALMDLGQMVCTPRRPRCAACPVAQWCEARRSSHPERFPRRRARPRLSRVQLAAAVAVEEGRALLGRRRDGLLRGLWQFPSAGGTTPRAAAAKLRRGLEPLGLRLDDSAPVVIQHTMVNKSHRILVFRASADPKSRIQNPTGSPSHRPSSPPGERAREKGASLRWFTPAGLRASALPTLTRKIGIAAGFLYP